MVLWFSLAAIAESSNPLIDSAGTVDSSLLETLKSGAVNVDLVEMEGENFIRGTVFVASDPQAVWEVMKSCRTTVEMVPQVKECHLIDEQADSTVVQHRVKLVFFLPSLDYRFRAVFVGGNRVVFEYLGGDLKDLKGEWEIQPLADHSGSIVSLRMRLVPGSLIPSSLVDSKLKQKLPSILRAFVAEVAARNKT